MRAMTVVPGTVRVPVNAAKRHYATAVDSLAAADRSWLERLVSRTVPLSDWPSALNKTPDDIKVAVDLQD
jgi:hypothetical protein